LIAPRKESPHRSPPYPQIFKGFLLRILVVEMSLRGAQLFTAAALGFAAAGLVCCVWVKKMGISRKKRKQWHSVKAIKDGECHLRHAENTNRDIKILYDAVHGLAKHLDEAVPNLSVARLHKDFNAGAFEALVAEIPGRSGTEEEMVPVGAAIFFDTYSTWNGRCLFVEDLYVEPKFRSKGIGTVLLRALAAMALQEGYCRLQWESSRTNLHANSYYLQAVGAVQVDDRLLWRLPGDRLAAFVGDSPI